MTRRGSVLPTPDRRPRWFAGRSIRGLLEVMPSRDLQFYGVTIGWVGIGFIRTVKKP